VFHRRIKMSSGGHRLKIEQKFQLLVPGVMPVKYHSIWHRYTLPCIDPSKLNNTSALQCPEHLYGSDMNCFQAAVMLGAAVLVHAAV
jgi:hypothetical protein